MVLRAMEAQHTVTLAATDVITLFDLPPYSTAMRAASATVTPGSKRTAALSRGDLALGRGPPTHLTGPRKGSRPAWGRKVEMGKLRGRAR